MWRAVRCYLGWMLMASVGAGLLVVTPPTKDTATDQAWLRANGVQVNGWILESIPRRLSKREPPDWNTLNLRVRYEYNGVHEVQFTCAAMSCPYRDVPMWVDPDSIDHFLTESGGYGDGFDTSGTMGVDLRPFGDFAGVGLIVFAALGALVSVVRMFLRAEGDRMVAIGLG